MSTDTDRIVNFCQSFHQFWSLPFQIVISLYLLYQQACSFLTGPLTKPVIHLTLTCLGYFPFLYKSLVFLSSFLVFLFWSGIPGISCWRGIFCLACAHQQIAGCQDRQTKHLHDDAEGPEGQSGGETPCLCFAHKSLPSLLVIIARLSLFFVVLQLMAEILRGIRVIKFYTWERVFSQRIKTLR